MIITILHFFLSDFGYVNIYVVIFWPPAVIQMYLCKTDLFCTCFNSPIRNTYRIGFSILKSLFFVFASNQNAFCIHSVLHITIGWGLRFGKCFLSKLYNSPLHLGRLEFSFCSARSTQWAKDREKMGNEILYYKVVFIQYNI